MKHLQSAASAEGLFHNRDIARQSKTEFYMLELLVLKQPSKMFCQKRSSQKIRKIQRKIPVPKSLFLIKLQASACNVTKKETLAQVFSFEFSEISKNTFLEEHLQEAASVIGKLTSLEKYIGPCKKSMTEFFQEQLTVY